METMSQTAVFAGGCFWCTEHDLRALSGVINVISGYTGREGASPSYHNHDGFRESVQVVYDPSKVNFTKLTQFFLDHIDPTDGGGQFYDRGESYKTAIYFKNVDEEKIAHGLIAELEESRVYDKPIVVDVLPEPTFYPAEEYHQDYAAKNPEHYAAYRNGSGREDFVNQTCQIREDKKINWKE